MRDLELALQDDNATSLTQLRRLKKEKEALMLTKDTSKKAKARAEAKVEATRKL